eukprot:gene8196-5722_t
MVLLTVKGTKFPDEFTVEFSTEDSLDTIPLDVLPPPPPPTMEEMKEMEKRNITVKPPAQVAAEYRRAKNDALALMQLPNQGIVPLVARLQNRRHYLRLMLLSARELADEATNARGVFSPNSTAKQCSTNALGTAARTPERLAAYGAFIDSTYELLKNKSHVITPDKRAEVDQLIGQLRQDTIDLFPEWCQPNGGGAPAPAPAAAAAPQRTMTASGAVVEELREGCVAPPAPAPLPSRRLTEEELNQVVSTLYGMHENPDLDEDERLAVYHCRLVLDDLWREEEHELAGEVGLWFASKLMSGKLGKYGNAKSKLIVRVANRNGPPPSGGAQNPIREKRETFKNLEESELRDIVVRQSRGRVALCTGSSGAIGLDPEAVNKNVRPIYSKREEHEKGEAFSDTDPSHIAHTQRHTFHIEMPFSGRIQRMLNAIFSFVKKEREREGNDNNNAWTIASRTFLFLVLLESRGTGHRSTMPSSLKEIIKIVRGSAEVLLGEQGRLVHETEGFLLVALAALKEAETSINASVQQEESTNLLEEMRAVRKSLRNVRRQVLAEPFSPLLANQTKLPSFPTQHIGVKRGREEEEEAKDQQKEQQRPPAGPSDALDLGQYASAQDGLFDGNAGKKNKFARLMGGGKAAAGQQSHTTLAASSADVKKINADLEREFNYALQHKNKKGLGA